MKEKILADIAELSSSEKMNNNLVEDYIVQLRDVEKENSLLNETIRRLQDDRSRLVEKQQAEIATISDVHRKTIDLMKTSMIRK